MLHDLMTSIRKYQARSRAIDALNAMTDQQLDDIGLHRSQIDAYVTGKRG